MVYLRKLMSNIFFLKYFVINYIDFCDFTHAINRTHKLTCVCACACACNCMCLREQYVDFWKVIYENIEKKNNIHFITNISILYGSQTY